MKSKRDIHGEITQQIIVAIEAGAGQFQMPWHRAGTGLGRPVNALTGKGYRGINILSLWVSAQFGNYSCGIWGTYRQWGELGAQVRKGEKSSLVVFYKDLDIDRVDPVTGETEAGTVFIAKPSPVFNADQVDGFMLPEQPARRDLTERVEAAERFIAATRAQILHGGEGRNAPHASIGVMWTGEDGRFTLVINGLETQVRLMAFPIEQENGDAQ